MVIVADQDAAGQALAASSMPCPSCSGGSLRPWGYARTRVLRGLHGARHRLRPRRARCRACGATHVLLPSDALARRIDTLQVVMVGLLTHHGGTGARRIAADLDVPVDTVRSWVRSAGAHAPWLREQASRWAYRMDPAHPPIQPTGSPLGDALNALGHAAAATTRRVARPLTAWQLIGLISVGRLLAPAASPRSG